MPDATWPDITYDSWADTLATLQLWSQIVGKVRLALTPWLNHSWQTPLYVSARGLTTSAIPAGGELVDIEFDFVGHRLICRSSRGDEQSLPLQARSVAAFYGEVLDRLHRLGVDVRIHDRPNETADPIPFAQDETHHSYDPEAAHRFWRALIQADRVLKDFRTGFLGKASPVHFFWGSFDLAVTRFSGRPAPLHPGGVPNLPDAVTREAYSHQVSSAGFWPGGPAFPEAVFYSYAYPTPPGFAAAPVQPTAARFEPGMGEFILPYEAVRQASDPDAVLLAFLQSTYDAAANLAHWDRDALECGLGRPRIPRPVAGAAAPQAA